LRAWATVPYLKVENIMKQFMRWVRKTCRFLFASFLWLHALFILDVAPSLAPYAQRLRTNVAELTVLLLLVVLNLLDGYGIGNVIVDALYIYFFPFIFLFYCVLLLFKAILKGYALLWGQDEPLNVSFEKIRAKLPTAQIPREQPVVVQAPQSVVPQTPPESQARNKRSVLGIALRPFMHFALLWGLLLLLASHRLFVWIALFVVLFHLAKFLIGAFALAIISRNWLGQLEQRLRKYADELINKALLAKEITQDLQQVWLALTALEIGIALLRNRRRIGQWTMYLGILFFLGIYLYLALVFSFAYYGVARLSNLSYAWATSFVNSLFMPFAFTGLPPNNWIKLLAGIHGFSVLALGIGTILGYIGQRLDSLHVVADELSGRLQQAEVRAKLAAMSEKFRQQQPPQVGTTAQPNT